METSNPTEKHFVSPIVKQWMIANRYCHPLIHPGLTCHFLEEEHRDDRLSEKEEKYRHRET